MKAYTHQDEDSSEYDSLGEHQSAYLGDPGLGLTARGVSGSGDISATDLLDRYFADVRSTSSLPHPPPLSDEPDPIMDDLHQLIDVSVRASTPRKKTQPSASIRLQPTINANYSSQDYDSRLSSFLDEFGLSKYLSTFASEEIHYEDLPSLTSENFKEMGLPIGPRNRLMGAIENRFKLPGGATTVPSSPAQEKRDRVSFGTGGNSSPSVRTINEAAAALMEQQSSPDKSAANRKRSGTVAFYEQMSQGVGKQVALLGNDSGDIEEDPEEDREAEDESSRKKKQRESERETLRRGKGGEEKEPVSRNFSKEKIADKIGKSDSRSTTSEKRGSKVTSPPKSPGKSPSSGRKNKKQNEKPEQDSSSSDSEESRAPAKGSNVRKASSGSNIDDNDVNRDENDRLQPIFADMSLSSAAIAESIRLLGTSHDESSILVPSHCVPFLSLSFTPASPTPGSDKNGMGTTKKTWALKIDELSTVGRSSVNTVSVLDPTMSRRHADLFYHQKTRKVAIIDGESSSGTLVNKKRLRKNTPVFLKRGDVVQFGKTVFTFNYNLATFKGLLDIKPSTGIVSSGKIGGGYNKVWCVLKKGKLHYYPNKDVGNLGAGKVLDLSGVTSVDEGEEGKDPTLIQLKGEKGMFCLKAQSRKERKLWAQGLRDHVAEAWRLKSKGKNISV